MKGTQKQIEWAEKIKRDALWTLDSMVQNCQRNDETLGSADTVKYFGISTEKMIEFRDNMRAAWEKIDDAGLIIDSRANHTRSAYNKWVRLYYQGIFKF